MRLSFAHTSRVCLTSEVHVLFLREGWPQWGGGGKAGRKMGGGGLRMLVCLVVCVVLTKVIRRSFFCPTRFFLLFGVFFVAIAVIAAAFFFLPPPPLSFPLHSFVWRSETRRTFPHLFPPYAPVLCCLLLFFFFFFCWLEERKLRYVRVLSLGLDAPPSGEKSMKQEQGRKEVSSGGGISDEGGGVRGGWA